MRIVYEDFIISTIVDKKAVGVLRYSVYEDFIISTIVDQAGDATGDPRSMRTS